MRSSRAIRSPTLVCEKLEKAARAAFTARSTSSAEPTEMRPAEASVAGLMTSMLRAVTGSTQLPSM